MEDLNKSSIVSLITQVTSLSSQIMEKCDGECMKCPLSSPLVQLNSRTNGPINASKCLVLEEVSKWKDAM